MMRNARLVLIGEMSPSAAARQVLKNAVIIGAARILALDEGRGESDRGDEGDQGEGLHVRECS